MTQPAINRPLREFRPQRYSRELLAIIRDIEALPGTELPSERALDAILRRYPRDGRGFFSRSQLIAGYRELAPGQGFRLGAEAFARRLRLRPVRSHSGVTPLTVLTQPYPCPGRCIFCPSDVRMPKSYLSAEPGAQRAAQNDFDPYLQAWNRLAALRAIGHPTDKIELIVLGGSWSFYPERYQLWFTRRCFEALNDFGSGVDRRAAARDRAPDFALPDADTERGTYNQQVARFRSRRAAAASDRVAQGGMKSGVRCGSMAWQDLERAQRANEGAAARCVGLVFETRPDLVTPEEVRRLRRLGATKVQLGVQSLSDAVLEQNRRGHDVAASRRAFALLRRAGFKIHAHWMPNLLGATPEDDVRDFARLFDDPAFCPDELKIYPCSLIESADLMEPYRRGEWKPYSETELLFVLTRVLVQVPRYCRTTRVVRDISSDDIVAGNKLTNFREHAEAELRRRGQHCCDIRSREIRRERFAADALDLRVTEYPTPIGSECFLEFVTTGDRIVAFLRLALPTTPPEFEELAGSALVREVHVYGVPVGVGERAPRDAQHRGLGRRLLEAAAQRAAAAEFRRLSVISAVGTRAYYRKLGFEDGALYQHRSLPALNERRPLSAAGCT